MKTKPYSKNRNYRVFLADQPVTLYLAGKEQPIRIVVPSGFVWDGASVPSAFRWLIGQPSATEFQLASLVHDYLYWSHKATRQDADEIFHQLLLRAGCPAWKAALMYRAVRVGAQSNYDNRAAGEFKIVQ